MNSLSGAFSSVHPIVSADQRIPRSFHESIKGEHPGIFLQRLREAAGMDTQTFVDAVNRHIRKDEEEFSALTPNGRLFLMAYTKPGSALDLKKEERSDANFTVERLAGYEQGRIKISNLHLTYFSEALKVNPLEILVGRMEPVAPELN